jgi:peptide subunit release factor 1 (eRF1)
MRKGYRAEYKTKQELIEKYGKENVLKVAIGGAVDFLVLKPGKNKIEKIVEVKECHKKKYYPTEREKDQLKRLKKLGKEHSIPCELWIKFPRKDFIKKKLI